MASRLLLLATSLALSLAALELTLGRLLPDLRGMRKLIENVDDPRGYRLHPGQTIEFEGMFERLSEPVLWRVTAQGFRGDRPVAASTQRFRIATYGDSEAFGWAVDLEDTFQRRMEAIDARVEAINFGVPGYNVAAVADQIEITLTQYRPALALYLVNRNDFDARIEIPDRVLDSRVLLSLRFLRQVTIDRPARVSARHSPERRAFFAAEAERIARRCEAQGVPLVLAFLNWSDRQALAASPRLLLHGVNLEPATRGLPKLDDHLGPEAHARMARALCAAISSSGDGCVPPAWAARQREAASSASAS